jgi:hypothetical protein
MNTKLSFLRLPGRDLGSWQFTLGQAMLFMTVLSLFCSCVAWRSAFGVLVSGGLTGLGLVIAGKRFQNGVFFAAGVFMILLTLGTLYVGYCYRVRGCGGHLKLPCTVRAVDARTGVPIRGAFVRLRDVLLTKWVSEAPSMNIPPGEPGIGSTTNRSGAVSLSYDFAISYDESYFSRWTKVFVPGYLYLHVSAPGYKPVLTPLSAYTEQTILYRGNVSTLKEVEVALERQSPNAGQPKSPPATTQPGGRPPGTLNND